MEGTDAELDKSDDEIRSLVRRAAAAEQQSVDLVAGFQKKLRKRSGGKFYADGWSTAKQPPIMTYLITSLIMLALVGAAYVVLRPLSGEPAAVPMEPAPVRVLPPPRNE
jgi:hypothetical protein